jgi:D-methionine transport system ATP-binding protein
MIEVRDLSKTFFSPQGPVRALVEVSLSVNAGEIFGIVGFSGAGKSTLLRCLNRLETPDAGTVIMDTRDVGSLDEKALARFRRRVGMIFQQFNLFDSRTVAGNVAFPLECAGVPARRIQTRVAELLDLVGLSDKAKSYPGQLSGGQKQRVGIARALANEPVVLLCDEATSALDPQTTMSTLDLLGRLNKTLGLTLVLVTHELDLVGAFCDRMAVMDAGRIVETGTVRKIFNDPQSTTARSFVGITRSLQDGQLYRDGAGV